MSNLIYKNTKTEEHNMHNKLYENTNKIVIQYETNDRYLTNDDSGFYMKLVALHDRELNRKSLPIQIR